MLACVASVSARVRRERRDENKKKKECSHSNFRAMIQLETLATQAMKMRPHLAAHPH